MPTPPQNVTLRPLTAGDLADAKVTRAEPGMDVFIRRQHAREDFYAKGRVVSIEIDDVYSDGRLGYQASPRDDERTIVGQKITVTARDEFGSEVTDHVFTSEETFDALYPKENKYNTRTTMLNALARRQIAVLGDGSDSDFEARTVPLYGAEVNLRLFIEDGDPQETLARLTALLAEEGRVVRAQARSLADFRVHVSRQVFDEDFNATEQLVAVNVLDAEVSEFMRTAAQGSISTRSIPYGATVPVIGA